MASAKHKRRQIVVDAALQIGLSMHVLGWLYFYVVVFAMLANAPSIWAVLTDASTDVSYNDAVQRMQWFTQFTVIPLALTFLCVAAHSIVFTHRIAGPIFRIKNVLRGMAQRQYPEDGVRLREKDYFKDVAADLDTVIGAVREDAACQRRMNQETLRTARELVAALEGIDRPEILAQAVLLRDRAQCLDDHLCAVAPQDADVPAAPDAPQAAALTEAAVSA